MSDVSDVAFLHIHVAGGLLKSLVIELNMFALITIQDDLVSNCQRGNWEIIDCFFWIAKLCKIFRTAKIGLLGPTLSVRCMIYCYCSGYCLTVYLPLKLNRKVGYVVSSSERR